MSDTHPFSSRESTNQDDAHTTTNNTSSELSRTARFFRRLRHVAVLRTQQKTVDDTARADKKLVHTLQSRSLPRPRQLRYLHTLLSQRERWLIVFSVFLVVVGVGLVLFKYIDTHLERIPTEGGKYTEAIVGIPQFINPILQTSDADKDISSLIFSGLLSYDTQGTLTTDLAKDYTISEDGKVYTFSLREDIVWHDGQPFTADDVLFTIESIQNPLYKSIHTFSFRGIILEKLDETTIQFTLEEPFAPFIGLLTIGIIPEHIWSHIAPESAALARANIQPIGTGPYRAHAFTLGEDGTIRDYTLIRNQVYYDTQPHIEKLVFKFYPTFEEALAAAAAKNVQGVSFVPQRFKKTLSEKEFVFYNLRLPQYTALFFHQEQQAILAEKNVRQALAHALDKERILREAIDNEGQSIEGPILPGYLGYSQDVEHYAYDTEKANTLLDDTSWEAMDKKEYETLRHAQLAEEREAAQDTLDESRDSDKQDTETDTPQEEVATTTDESLTLPDIPFFRVNKDGEALTLTLTMVDTPANESIAYLLQEMWGAVGVQLNIQAIPGSRIRRDVLKPRDYEILLLSEVVGFDPDPYVFWHSSQTEHPGLNFAKLANRHVDTLLEEARQAIDVSVRKEKYQEFQALLAKELPALFLYTPTYTHATSHSLKGVGTKRITIPADRFSDITNWYIRTHWKWE